MAIEFTQVAATVIVGAVAAAVYAGLSYAQRRQEGERFQPVPFVATVAVGAAWGAILALNGQAATITPEATAAAITSYAGLVVFTEKLIKYALATRR